MFPDGVRANPHEANAHPKDRHSCKTCQKEFGSKENLDRHQKLHEVKIGISCGFCKKTFDNYRRDNFQAHQQSCRKKVLEVSSKENRCHKCGDGGFQ